MTSEIAVMNQRAVALAADSAVTLIDGGKIVVRNEHQKLFNLLPGKPIGVMFYGGAEVMGHPWEHLIDNYQRKVKPGPQAHVQNYAAGFVNSLDNLEEFFPLARQSDEFKRLLVGVYRYVLGYANYLAHNSGEEKADERRILATVIGEVWRGYQFGANGAPRADLACFPPGFGQQVAAHHAKDIDEVVAYVFGSYGLAAQSLQQLREIAIFAVVKDLFLEDITGLVFAGFGEDDRYPAIVTWYASAIVGGIMKRKETDVSAIDGDVHSEILLFADSGAASAFIHGIDPGLERHMYDGVATLMGIVADSTIDGFAQTDPAQRDGVRQHVMDDVLPGYFSSFYRYMSRYQQILFVTPVLRVVEIVGRSELAQIARDLVNLNIFKKRIMAEVETVGGEVVSAVISRDGGFQWTSKGS